MHADSASRQHVRYHMRDQVRHRVREIMRAEPGVAGPTARLWPAAALVLIAFAVANILMTAPAP